MIILENNYLTGYPSNVLEYLHRSISQYSSWGNRIKVGITNNPERRLMEHERSNQNWQRMVVMYKSTSINNTSWLERELVERNWERVENEIFGGGGGIGEGFQYLYVLLRLTRTTHNNS